jgi:hypothetical protein
VLRAEKRAQRPEDLLPADEFLGLMTCGVSVCVFWWHNWVLRLVSLGMTGGLLYGKCTISKSWRYGTACISVLHTPSLNVKFSDLRMALTCLVPCRPLNFHCLDIAPLFAFKPRNPMTHSPYSPPDKSVNSKRAIGFGNPTS